MKVLILFISTMISAGALASGNPTETRERVVNVNEALVPSQVEAYDEEVKVQISGFFSNSCYSFNKVQTTQEKSTNTYIVKTIADVQRGHCLMVMVPFMKAVNLGKFEPGEYTIRFLNGDDTYFEKKLKAE